ncbi:MAG TPA: histidine phosphatase family protein [Phycisphaerae bacterium]|nr:histidine phosphatase family protein [Phycisphaerae bacterium]
MTSTATTEFIVIRHGETIWNVQGRLQGHQDSALTPLGLQQAAALATRLAAERFDALYSSDLPRARTTATCISDITGHAVIQDPRLRERNYGMFEGLTTQEIAARYPEEYQRFVSRDPDHPIPGGESRSEKFLRVTACMEDIARQRPGRRVVIVAHGGVLGDLYRRASGLGPADPLSCKIHNASLNTVFIQDGRWTLGPWGETRHLSRIGSDNAGIESQA